MKDTHRTLIRQASLFKDTSEAGFERVLQARVLRSMEADGFFFMQGDPASHAYVLLEGRVKMLQVTLNGQQIALRWITPGQTFGGIALLHPETGYPATAQAVEDSLAAAWNTESLHKLAVQETSVSFNAMQLMHGYILELQSRQQALVTGRVEQRIALILLKLAAQTGKKEPEGILIDMPLTRQDIAEMSGTTLFTVSRTLNDWERRGILQIGRARVVIREPHSLVKIAEDLL